MRGHECYHCKQWVEEGEAHDCWTTTEAALTRDLSDDLQEAWERLRDTATGFGEQRIYASHNSIMFARTSCYFFVRPKKSFLEVVIFLGRAIRSPRISRAERTSKTKVAHFVKVRHRDEVEPPLSEWLQEAYERNEALGARKRTQAKRQAPARKQQRQPAAKQAKKAR